MQECLQKLKNSIMSFQRADAQRSMKEMKSNHCTETGARRLWCHEVERKKKEASASNLQQMARDIR